MPKTDVAVTSTLPTRRELRATRQAEAQVPETVEAVVDPDKAKPEATAKKTRKVKKTTTKIRVGRSPLRALTAGLGVLAFAIVLFAVGATMVVPRVLGGTAVKVTNDSMAPMLSVGDVVVLRGVLPEDACGQVSIGDIVGYLPTEGSSELVTRRVASKSVGGFADGTSCRFTVRGDRAEDSETQISPIQVSGLFAYRVPILGTPLDWVGRNRPLAIGALVVLMLGSIVASHRKPKVTVKTSRVAEPRDSSSQVAEPRETTRPKRTGHRAAAEPQSSSGHSNATSSSTGRSDATSPSTGRSDATSPSSRRSATSPSSGRSDATSSSTGRSDATSSSTGRSDAISPSTGRSATSPSFCGPLAAAQNPFPSPNSPPQKKRSAAAKPKAEPKPEPAYTEADLVNWDLNLRERELALREARFAHAQSTMDSSDLWASVAALVGADQPSSEGDDLR